MNRTTCNSYFSICSEGEHRPGYGWVAEENAVFDPDEITRRLKITPFQCAKPGELRGDGSVFHHSAWAACKQEEPVLDTVEQCRKIVRSLKPLIPELLRIKDDYHVGFTIYIVPEIFQEEVPAIGMDHEIIEFCYLTGTEIDIDLYV